MTITAFVPDWNATPEMSERAEKRKGYRHYVGWFDGWDIQFSDTFGCDVIQLKNRAEHMPDGMSKIPLRAIVVLKPNSPMTSAIDGQYKDGNIEGRVETYVKDGVTQQFIRVVGTNDTTVEALNEWFDKLLAGEQAEYNLGPIVYSAATTPSDDSLVGKD